MILNELRPPYGSNANKKRLGRGESSGLGKTSGRGHKGQKARSGGYHKVGFEGGQMPLTRRLPKRGFVNIFKQRFALVNVGDLNKLTDVSEVDLDVLIKRRLVNAAKGRLCALKILGDGDLQAKLVVKAQAFSLSAKEKIEKVGGQALVI